MRVPVVVSGYIEALTEVFAGLHVLEDRPGVACDFISRTAYLGMSDNKRWDIQWLWYCAPYERRTHDWYTYQMLRTAVGPAYPKRLAGGSRYRRKDEPLRLTTIAGM